MVTSHVVTQSISELRKSLKDGDDGSMEYIATVPKRGYKLTVPVICVRKRAKSWRRLSRQWPLSPFLKRRHRLFLLHLLRQRRRQCRKNVNGSPPFWVWTLFLLALGSCVALVALSSIESRPPETKTRLLLNPRDIDIHPVKRQFMQQLGIAACLCGRVGQPGNHLAQHFLDLYGPR